mgnify:CR=1 FL=1
MKSIVVSGSFEDLRAGQVRFLQEAARLGEVTVLLWPDEEVRRVCGARPRIPGVERLYQLGSIQYVQQVLFTQNAIERDALPFAEEAEPEIWIVPEDEDSYQKRLFCASTGLGYHVIRNIELLGWPGDVSTANPGMGHKKKGVVSGAFELLLPGDVNFLEEASQFGELHVVVANDVNVRWLLGSGHPFGSQDERRYMVQSIRYVQQAVIGSGSGWMDAGPEIELLQPDIYIVDEDGDRIEKRDYCEKRGIEYVVLKRRTDPGILRQGSAESGGF